MSEHYYKSQLQLIEQLDSIKVSEAVRLMSEGITPVRSCLMVGLQLPSMLVERINVIYNGRFNYTKEGKGRKSMQKYLIARRDIQDVRGWNCGNKETQEAIRNAQLSYAKGLSEMATGRDGMYLLLYSIPRRFKDEKRSKEWLEGRYKKALEAVEGNQ